MVQGLQGGICHVEAQPGKAEGAVEGEEDGAAASAGGEPFDAFGGDGGGDVRVLDAF